MSHTGNRAGRYCVVYARPSQPGIGSQGSPGLQDDLIGACSFLPSAARQTQPGNRQTASAIIINEGPSTSLRSRLTELGLGNKRGIHNVNNPRNGGKLGQRVRQVCAKAVPPPGPVIPDALDLKHGSGYAWTVPKFWIKHGSGYAWTVPKFWIKHGSGYAWTVPEFWIKHGSGYAWTVPEFWIKHGSGYAWTVPEFWIKHGSGYAWTVPEFWIKHGSGHTKDALLKMSPGQSANTQEPSRNRVLSTFSPTHYYTLY
ncbi:hypothetical protein Bbelb_120490 [Branchiostoma belcheri]|nr:hypothetical protein Bbelb_120490 [Branchiostoma belcheri]